MNLLIPTFLNTSLYSPCTVVSLNDDFGLGCFISFCALGWLAEFRSRFFEVSLKSFQCVVRSVIWGGDFTHTGMQFLWLLNTSVFVGFGGYINDFPRDYCYWFCV